MISSPQNLLYTTVLLQKKMLKYIYVQIKTEHICPEPLPHIKEMHRKWNI
jgi:hypothetical protein